MNILEKSFFCIECNQGFPSAQEFDAHKQMHAELKLTCPICHKSFANAKTLKNHEIVHTGIYIFSYD